MSFFTHVKNNNEISITITNEQELNKVITEKIKVLAGDFFNDYSPMYKSELYECILKSEITNYIIKNKLIEENKGYIIKVTIGKENRNYSIVNLQSKNIGSGYSIALTLQD